jgi:hypothetical protein
MKTKMSAGGKLLIAAGLILIVAVVQHLLFNVIGLGDNRVLVMRDTGIAVNYDMGAGAQFHNGGSRGFYFCTKDGMEYISNDGVSQWKDIFSLTKPGLSAAGDIVAVADAMGSRVYVYNTNGQAYSVDLDYPLLSFSVNRAGYLAVILKLDTGYSARIYNARNYVEPLAFYEIYDAQMHPVAMTVSEDGVYAAIAMWNLKVRYESRVDFYYVNETDSWAAYGTDGMYASENYDGQAVLALRFMEENRAVVVTDSRIDCFQPGEVNTLSEIWSVEIHNELDFIAFGSNGQFAFATGDKLLNDVDSVPEGEVYIYNTLGEHTGSFSLGRKATSLVVGSGAVLAGAGRRFYALDFTGERLWDYTAIFDALGMYFLGDTNTVLLAGNNSAGILRREKEQIPRTETEAPDIDTLDVNMPDMAAPDMNVPDMETLDLIAPSVSELPPPEPPEIN